MYLKYKVHMYSITGGYRLQKVDVCISTSVRNFPENPWSGRARFIQDISAITFDRWYFSWHPRALCGDSSRLPIALSSPAKDTPLARRVPRLFVDPQQKPMLLRGCIDIMRRQGDG